MFRSKVAKALNLRSRFAVSHTISNAQRAFCTSGTQGKALEQGFAQSYKNVRTEDKSLFDKVKDFVFPPKAPEQPPIVLKCVEGDLEAVKQLLANDKQALRHRDEAGFNAATAAAANGHFDVLKYLLENGARVNSENKKTGYTLLHYAAHNADEEMLKLLLSEPYKKRIKLNIPELDQGFAPMHLAVLSSSLPCLELLIDAGADIRQREARGMTVLHLAVAVYEFAMQSYLLKQDKTLALMTSYSHGESCTALHYACSQGDEGSTMMVVNYSDLSQRDANSLTPMHRAVLSKNVNVVKQLITRAQEIQKALDTNTLTEDMKQILSYSEQVDQHVEIKDAKEIKASKTIEQLNPSAFDSQRPKPLKEQEHVHDENCNHGNDTREQKSAEAEFNPGLPESNVTEIELSYLQACIDGPTMDGRRPLIFACQNGLVDIAKALLEAGADPNAFEAQFGLTPLHVACRSDDSIDIVKLLLSDKRVNVNAKTLSGLTPLHFAARTATNEELFRVLLDKGADVNAVDDWGFTPLQVNDTCGAAKKHAIRNILVSNDPEAAVASQAK